MSQVAAVAAKATIMRPRRRLAIYSFFPVYCVRCAQINSMGGGRVEKEAVTITEKKCTEGANTLEQ